MSLMTVEKLQAILEAAIMVAGHPLSLSALAQLFPEDERPENADIKTALGQIEERYQTSGIMLVEVASGYRFQARTELSPWLSRLWEERAPRYSRAFLETLALIAYKQPLTRGEIEEIRGVTVSTNIMKTLQEREWVRVVGFREVPGKPALYGTTKTFLDHFNLKSLTDLPTLAEFTEIEAQDDTIKVQLAMEDSALGPENSEVIPQEREVHIEMAETTENETIESIEVMIEETPDQPLLIEAVEAVEANHFDESTIDDFETLEDEAALMPA